MFSSGNVTKKDLDLTNMFQKDFDPSPSGLVSFMTKEKLKTKIHIMTR